MRTYIAYLTLALLGGLASNVLADESLFSSNYQKLLENPSKSIKNYQKLRDEYADLATYDPSIERFKEDLYDAEGSINKGNYTNAINSLLKVIAAEPINATAHWLLSLCYEADKNETLSIIHKEFSDGLLNSILSSGEFGNPNKPFHVVTMYEVTATLDYLGGSINNILHIVDNNGHVFWVNATKKDTGEESTFYFEVNKIIIRQEIIAKRNLARP